MNISAGAAGSNLRNWFAPAMKNRIAPCAGAMWLTKKYPWFHHRLILHRDIPFLRPIAPVSVEAVNPPAGGCQSVIISTAII